MDQHEILVYSLIPGFQPIILKMKSDFRFSAYLSGRVGNLPNQIDFGTNSQMRETLLEISCYYAAGVIGGRWLEVEPLILNDPLWTYRYAYILSKANKHCLSWALATLKNLGPRFCYEGACNVLKLQWIDVEEIIAQDDRWWALYSHDVLRGPKNTEWLFFRYNKIAPISYAMHVSEIQENKERTWEEK